MISGIIRNPGNTLAAAWLFNQLAYAIVYPFIPLYLANERGIPYTLVSLIFPLMGGTIMLVPPLAGILADRFGRNLMMDMGQFLRGVAFLILAGMTYWDAPFWLFALLLMFNAGVGVVFQVGADAYLSDITTLQERPNYYGKIRIGFNLGWALGPMLGAFFAKTPFWLFFLITSLLCFAGTVFTHYACRIEGKQSAPQEKQKLPKESILPLLLTRKRLLCLLGGSLFVYLLASQLYSTMSIYSTAQVGISREALGAIYSLNGFTVIALQIPLTALMTKWNVPLKIQLLTGAVLYGLGFGLLGIAENAWMIAGFVFLLTVGEVVTQPALYASVSAEAEKQNTGRIMASLALVRGVAYAAGPWLGSILLKYLSSPVALWALLGAFALIAACFFILPPRTRKHGKFQTDY